MNTEFWVSSPTDAWSMKGLSGAIDEPAARQPPLRPPRRPSFGEDDRGRLLRRPGPRACGERAGGGWDDVILRDRPRPARLRLVLVGPGLPHRVGRGRLDALGGHAALPQ